MLGDRESDGFTNQFAPVFQEDDGACTKDSNIFLYLLLHAVDIF